MEAKKARKGVSILSYRLLVITACHTITHVFQRIYVALFPIIRMEFKLSLQQLGVIAAIPSLCESLFYIPTGLFSDRFGSKRMILVSLIVAALGSLLVSQTLNPVMLTLAVSLLYINTTIYHPAAYSFISQLFKPRDRPKALGIQGAGGGFARAIGPISVGVLMGIFAFGWRQIYLFWFIPILLTIIAVLIIKFESTENVRVDAFAKAKSQYRNESLFTLNLVLFIVFLAIRTVTRQMVTIFIPIYLVDEKGLSEVISSLIYGSSALLVLVGSPVGGILTARLGEKRWLLSTFSLSIVSLAVAIVAPNIIAFLVFYFSYTFCESLGMAARAAIMARLSPSKKRGLGYALYFLPRSIMGAVAPIITAHVADVFGWTSTFIFALVISAIGFAVFKLGVKV